VASDLAYEIRHPFFSRAVDYADLYFQYTRSEGWSLEEGIVKSGSFSIDQGVGVRAVSGEKTAFAYSDDISLAALISRGAAPRARSRAAGRARRARRWRAAGGHASSTRRTDPLASLDDRQGRAAASGSSASRARATRASTR
jgi:TldD protein